LLDSTFWHMYTYDFRGRRYCSSAFFHEQGTDLSKGLLLYEHKRRIGKQGFFWLLISIASNWSGASDRADKVKTDKLPMSERIYWTLDHEETLLTYANDPKTNQGWMRAEKPWQFLAACIELKKVREHQASTGELYDYQSGLLVYIDGSTNGAQHLSALSKDDTTAPLVNLTASQLPGDLYSHVANHVWLKITKDTSAIGDVNHLEAIIDKIIEMKAIISSTLPKSTERAEMIAEMAIYRDMFKSQIKEAAPLFWNRISDSKEKRKISKRGTMTLAYGSTSYGMSKQVQEDARKHGIPLLLALEASWASYMGRSLYEDCKLSLQRPAQLLAKFEQAGKQAEADNRFLKWTLPVTNFPVVQHYTEGAVKKIYVQYGAPIGERCSTGYFTNTLQLSVCFTENPIISKRKQGLGASPNAIHSLDAAHLMMIVCESPFDTTTIHDSFGCALADMADLFTIVREQFVRLYENDPLERILTEMGVTLDGVEIGALDIRGVLDSEYAFA
jgi:DNA-directed RNA polymerase